MPNTRHPTCRDLSRDRAHGFSLIELLIAIAIVAIITSIALPIYKDSIRKSRRSEAFAALALVQQAQERWRSNHESYADDAAMTTATTATPAGMGLPSTTTSGRYSISVVSQSATGYELLATAVSGGSQAEDGDCVKLAVKLSGGAISYGAGASTIDWTDAKRCWVRT